MEFSSLEELVRYVESKQSRAMNSVGKEMKEIMKQETNSQVDAYSNSIYENTGDIIDCIDITDMSKDSVEVSWKDNGDWHSVIDGNHMYAPYALENGTAWGRGKTRTNLSYRPKTNFVEESMDKIKSEIPNEYKRIMNGLGVPLK